MHEMHHRTTDIAIIGAGIAGATLAAALGGQARVLLIEAESQPGYHSTGRSAAFWSESYGGPAIQPLTTASEGLLSPHLGPRSCLHIADSEGEAALDRLAASFKCRAPTFRVVDREELETRIPGLSGSFLRALEEPSCQDIDVAAYHAAELSAGRAHGVELLSDAPVTGIARRAGGWEIEMRPGSVRAEIVVNAAGAWAGGIAALVGATPIAITPYRRTIVQLVTAPAAKPDMPLIMDARERFYFKPEAGGRVWLSPHDETSVAPQDVAPEELDVAIAIDRFEHVVDWRVVKKERSWAGLRSFAPDRVPIYGFDDRADGFFWFAGQGGFGIQTAPAAAAIAAALLLDRVPADFVSSIEIDAYSPRRFRD